MLDSFDQTLPRREWLSAPRSTAAKDLSAYRPDPVGYCRDVLGVTLTPDQEQIALSVRDNRRTAVMASHSVGKTFLAAALANWWYDCWDEHIVYITAPTWHQALNLCFKQVKRFRLTRRLGGQILDSGLVRDLDRLRATAHLIQAINAGTGEGFQGEHTAPILIVMEEAVGVPAHIWEAADGLMTHPDCRLLAIANPTNEATLFGMAVKSGIYHTLRINAMDHLNIAAELKACPPPFPGAVRLKWLAEMLQKEAHAADNPDGESLEYWDVDVLHAAVDGRPVRSTDRKRWYRPTAAFEGRVLGRFPTQADEQVIPRGWLESLPCLDPAALSALARTRPEIGCDVARHGSDRTVIVVRHGPVIHSLRSLRMLDNLQVTAALQDAAEVAAALWEPTREPGADPDLPVEPADPRKIPIKIDVTGGLGTGPFDILRKQGYHAIPVNASAQAADPEQYARRRPEMWFTMRFRVREKRLDLSRLDAAVREELITELSAPAYWIDGGGRKVVEPKEDTKEKIARSPDMADAVLLAFTDMGRWWQDPDLTRYLKVRAGALESEPETPAPASSKGKNLMDALG